MEQSDYRKPLILIFAADEDSQVLYETLLKTWNYDVIKTTIANEISALSKSHHPNIVLMDTQINFFDSLLLMKKLKADIALSETPFVLLSGHAQTKNHQAAIAAGAKHFCVKPVDFSVLESILNDCLNKTV